LFAESSGRTEKNFGTFAVTRPTETEAEGEPSLDWYDAPSQGIWAAALGYAVDTSDSWWSRTGQVVVDPTQFYLPVEAIDIYGAASSVQWDTYGLLVEQSTDALGNTQTVVNDYQFQGPVQVTDPNGVRSGASVDVLKRVVATWIQSPVGATNEGDSADSPSWSAAPIALSDPALAHRTVWDSLNRTTPSSKPSGPGAMNGQVGLPRPATRTLQHSPEDAIQVHSSHEGWFRSQGCDRPTMLCTGSRVRVPRLEPPASFREHAQYPPAPWQGTPHRTVLLQDRHRSSPAFLLGS
jgi:hypothetical protein